MNSSHTTSSRASSRTSSTSGPLFNHENLSVYQKSLAFAALVRAQVATWDARHAIVNHFPRAAESAVESIASASAAFNKTKQSILDTGLGSVLECAACIDIACIKNLLRKPDATLQKQHLVEIYRMLIGLRRSWARNTVKEGPATYEIGAHEPPKEETGLFAHEGLDVYHVALEMMIWFYQVESGQHLGASDFRKLDGLTTSVILNIAEGNGRFSELDHRRFLDIAHNAAIKMAAYLDLCILSKVLDTPCVSEGKQRLARISRMTMAMMAGMEE